MNRINYVFALQEFGENFKKEGNIYELMRIQTELASIATSFRILGRRPDGEDGFDEDAVEASEAALNALKSLEKIEYHAGVKTLKDPTEMGELTVKSLYASYQDVDDLVPF